MTDETPITPLIATGSALFYDSRSVPNRFSLLYETLWSFKKKRTMFSKCHFFSIAVVKEMTMGNFLPVTLK